MNPFHKIWLILIMFCGMPIAGLGLLLVVPASLDFNPAAFLFLIPSVLVIWDILLLLKGNAMQNPRKSLLTFYIVTGIISTWSITWTYNRDGVTGYIFDFEPALIIVIFFLIPIIVTFCSKSNRKSTQQED